MTKDAKSIRPMASRNSILALFAVLALSLGAAWCHSAAAQISAEITIGVPPPFVAQPLPAPRLGYVWAPGYWAWDGREYLWYEGHWEVVRPEERFVGAVWVQTNAGWRFVPGHWERGDHERWEGDHDHWEYAEPGRGPQFCPPGQAKHGRC